MKREDKTKKISLATLNYQYLSSALLVIFLYIDFSLIAKKCQ